MSQVINVSLNNGSTNQMKAASMVCSSHNQVCYESFFPFVCLSNLWSKLISGFFASLSTVLSSVSNPNGWNREKKHDQEKKRNRKRKQSFCVISTYSNFSEHFFFSSKHVVFLMQSRFCLTACPCR